MVAMESERNASQGDRRESKLEHKRTLVTTVQTMCRVSLTFPLPLPEPHVDASWPGEPEESVGDNQPSHDAQAANLTGRSQHAPSEGGDDRGVRDRQRNP